MQQAYSPAIDFQSGSPAGGIRTPVILIYDVGKTNKKLLLFDEDYNIVYDEVKKIAEVKDEDQFPSDDITAISSWIKESFERIMNDRRYELRAVNFSAYGASFVYLDEDLKVTAPLYNYLKPFPHDVAEPFYKKYGGEESFALATSSPVLGSLNSGLQLYRISRENPGLFKRIRYALHLPQYLSFLLTGSLHAELTSIGCHTSLWDYKLMNYHSWVTEEALEPKFPPIKKATEILKVSDSLIAGMGIHDSSAALVPLLQSFPDTFVLISTGTWCIALNPFNHHPLTPEELQQDCLCYMSWEGKPVKASRVMAGFEHEEQTRRLSSHFNVPAAFFDSVQFDPALAANTDNKSLPYYDGTVLRSGFGKRSPGEFKNFEVAYHQLIADIVRQQVKALNLVLQGNTVENVLVDGNFAGNSIYMHMLAATLSNYRVYSTGIPNASATGAAMVIHDHWNSKPLRNDIVHLERISSQIQSIT